MANIYTDASLRTENNKLVAQVGYFDKSYKEKIALKIDTDFYSINESDIYSLELLAVVFAIYYNIENNKLIHIFNDNKNMVTTLNKHLKKIKLLFKLKKDLQISWLKRTNNKEADKLSKESLLKSTNNIEDNHFKKIENPEEFRLFYFQIRKLLIISFNSPILNEYIEIKNNKPNNKSKEKQLQPQSKKLTNLPEWETIKKIPFNKTPEKEIDLKEQIILHSIVEEMFSVLKSQKEINKEVIYKIISTTPLEKHLRHSFIYKVMREFHLATDVRFEYKLDFKKLSNIFLFMTEAILTRRDLNSDDLEIIVYNIDKFTNKKIIKKEDKLKLLDYVIKNRKEVVIKQFKEEFLHSDDYLKTQAIAKCPFIDDNDLLFLLNEHPDIDVKIACIFNPNLHEEWFEHLMEYIVKLNENDIIKNVILHSSKAMQYIILNHYSSKLVLQGL